MPIVVFLIFVLLMLCMILGQSIDDAWGNLWASGAWDKVSIETTGIEVEDDAVVVTTIVTNEDWLSHPVCVDTKGTLYGTSWVAPDALGPVEAISFVAYDRPSLWPCEEDRYPTVRIWGNSSQTVIFRLASAGDWYTEELIAALRSGSYKDFEACATIIQIEGVYSGLQPVENFDHDCMVVSGPQ